MLVEHQVAGGARIAADLALSPEFASQHLIASQAWQMHMIQGGRDWKRNTNFQVVGATAAQFLANLAAGGLKSYLWRLFAIRQFAVSLTGGPALTMINSLIDANFDFGPLGIYAWARTFAEAAGRGWGVTTVQHMLTDLGLGIKNDLHLRRSAIRMGLLMPAVPNDLPQGEIDPRAAQLDPQIVSYLVAMASHVQPTANPAAQSALREIDKVLMEWSRQGFARPL